MLVCDINNIIPLIIPVITIPDILVIVSPIQFLSRNPPKSIPKPAPNSPQATRNQTTNGNSYNWASSINIGILSSHC